jgi:hypothetical protein
MSSNVNQVMMKETTACMNVFLQLLKVRQPDQIRWECARETLCFEDSVLPIEKWGIFGYRA